ncbi:anti-sigma factor family protein [Aquabacterium sp.]|uniref:anti-sigma factor family protein n=1 Tax=Aquabacterium sp. TaxID=1872578 RepID=UPI002BAC630E|nr:hypothetical protein [Aquabacterium sp.]HSW08351.1 hypothetical protein [Aquabacterium sp.]
MSDRFQELLPFYVNGSLGAEDREWVDRHVAEHDDARAELAWCRSLQSRLQDEAPAVSASIGLDKAMQRIRSEPARTGLGDRIAAFFGLLGVRPVTAFAGLAIMAVQGGVIVSLMQDKRSDADGPITEMRAPQATAVHEGPMLKLNFAPDAKEAEIRHLLMSVQGHLAGGPGQLGDYFVVVPVGKEAALAEQIRHSPIVQAVTLAPGLPPRE